MSVTIYDYIRSIKEEIIFAKQNDVRGFLVKPSPAQLRNLCLLLLDEGLNSNDKVIFESFFSATNEDDLRRKIENVDIDKFRPIRNLLEDEIDISRGDMIVRENNQPNATQDLELMVCWFNEKPLQLNGKYKKLFESQFLEK